MQEGEKMTKIVELKDVTFGYDEQMVLEKVSLEVYQGDYLGIIGPNGSAKSTLLKLILGIEKPLKGTIRLFGEEIHKFKQWNKIGYVSQKSNSFNKSFPATVEEIIKANLIATKRNHKKFYQSDPELVDWVLEVVKMKDYKKRLIGNLSGGQQQRIFIAKALVSKPEFLILDEPTVGIDMASKEIFYDIIGDLNQKWGMTIILVSHDIGVITEKVNRIACMGNQTLYIHDNDKKRDMDQFIKKVYGQKIKKIHHHYHE